MTVKPLGGLMPILPAAFHDDGELDLEGLASVVRHTSAAGVDGAVLFGLVTEYYKLADEEKWRMVRAARDAMPATCNLVVSITAHAAEVAVKDAQRAVNLGADAIMIMPPFFLQPSSDAVARHIERVANAVGDTSVIVQYSPIQTGLNLNADMFAAWGDTMPNVRYVKVESVPPGPLCSRIHDASGGKMGAFVGYAGLQWLDVLQRTGAGCMPSCGFIEFYVRFQRLFKEGRVSEAEALHRRTLPLIEFVMQGIELVIKCEKVILKHRGWIASDYCREPSYALDTRQQAELIRLFDELGTMGA
jgi:dihydrodipicolinate synthase/N-acetylneuraminate lyase